MLNFKFLLDVFVMDADTSFLFPWFNFLLVKSVLKMVNL